MTLVLLIFKQMLPLSNDESFIFNDAHTAVAQYKHTRSMWFGRIPQIGEVVRFPAPQGRDFVFFRVSEVQHIPREAALSSDFNSNPQSLIFLTPIFAA